MIEKRYRKCDFGMINPTIKRQEIVRILSQLSLVIALIALVSAPQIAAAQTNEGNCTFDFQRRAEFGQSPELTRAIINVVNVVKSVFPSYAARSPSSCNITPVNTLALRFPLDVSDSDGDYFNVTFFPNQDFYHGIPVYNGETIENQTVCWDAKTRTRLFFTGEGFCGRELMELIR